jgi:hypothetical protein
LQRLNLIEESVRRNGPRLSGQREGLLTDVYDVEPFEIEILDHGAMEWGRRGAVVLLISKPRPLA